MQIYLDLKEYNKDEKASFYNHLVYVKKDSSNPLKIKLEFYDDEDKVDIYVLRHAIWDFICTTSYYDNFELDNPIIGTLGEMF